MTFNFANLQQIAVSIVGALVASSLFISAAVGPVGQLV
jgi:ABC-type multidrug transport system permease subunit